MFIKQHALANNVVMGCGLISLGTLCLGLHLQDWTGNNPIITERREFWVRGTAVELGALCVGLVFLSPHDAGGDRWFKYSFQLSYGLEGATWLIHAWTLANPPSESDESMKDIQWGVRVLGFALAGLVRLFGALLTSEGTEFSQAPDRKTLLQRFAVFAVVVAVTVAVLAYERQFKEFSSGADIIISHGIFCGGLCLVGYLADEHKWASISAAALFLSVAMSFLKVPPFQENPVYNDVAFSQNTLLFYTLGSFVLLHELCHRQSLFFMFESGGQKGRWCCSSCGSGA